MKNIQLQEAVPVLRSKEDVRRYIEQRSARNANDDPSVRHWRVLGRATLLAVLTYSTLQYYFLHVLVEILSLPSLTTFSVPLLGAG